MQQQKCAHLGAWLQGSSCPVGTARVRFCDQLSTLWARDGRLDLAPSALGRSVLPWLRKIAYVIEHKLYCTLDSQAPVNSRLLLMLRIWEIFLIPVFGIMCCKVEVCMSAFMYVVCERRADVLEAFTQTFSGACSLLCKWDFLFFAICMYSFSIIT